MNVICNSIVGYIVLCAFTFSSSSQLFGPKKGFDENATTTRGPNIIYDVTESVNNYLYVQPNYFFNNSDLYIDSTPYLYYRIDAGQNSSISANDVVYWLASPDHQKFGVSFLVQRYTPFLQTLEWSLEQQHPNYFVLHELFPPDTVIYRISSKRTSENCMMACPDEELMLTIQEYLMQIRNESFQIGLQYNERFIDCCSNRYPYILQRLSVAILNVQFDFTISLLSYSLFIKQLNEFSERNRLFLKGINTNCLPYLQVKLPPLSLEEFSSAELNLYRAYISEYTRSWSLKHSDNDVVVIDSFPNDIEATQFIRKKYQNIHPVLQLTAGFLFWSNDWYDLVISPCQLRTAIETVGQVAENLHLEYFHITVGKSLLRECKTVSKYNLTASHKYPFLHLYNNFESAKSAVNIVRKIEKHSDGIYKIKRIYFQKYPPLEDSPETKHFWTSMYKRNISVGCMSNMITALTMKTLLKGIIDECGLVFQKSPLLLLNWSYGIESKDISDLNIALKGALDVRTAFRKRYPDGDIVLQPNVRDQLITLDTSVTDPEIRLNIYCAKHLEATYSFNEIIGTWAQIHNFTVNLGRVVDAAERGMWDKVYTDLELDREITDFAVLVRRNVPEMIHGAIEFPFTYECLKYTFSPDSAIKFETNQFAGITFETNLKNSPLPTSDELQTMLLYCYGRFPSVEIRAFQYELLNTVFTPEFNGALSSQFDEIGDLKLYLDFKDMNTLNVILNTLLNFNTVLSVGLHLSSWENHTSETNNQINSALKTYSLRQSVFRHIGFGLSIKNCLQEMNSDLETLKALHYLSHIQYIVCNVKPVFPKNEDRESMQVFFDTNFYVQQYFKDRLNIDVIFRLNFATSYCTFQKSDIANYLRFINDTNQHSKAYSVKYFMSEAFNTPESKCKWSWWKISDLDDLTNDAVYTELESEYFDRETKRKIKIVPVVTKLLKDYKLIIGLSVLSFFLIGTVVGVLLYYRRMRNRFLTKSEVYAFRKGVILKSDCTEDLELYDIKKHQAGAQPFILDFEISKDTIKLGNVIGSGNFGVVYKATLKNDNIVAVKTPPTNCSKETFKTMLAEVKVLCFIGLHPNVLCFIGAYTKEIEKGRNIQ